MKNLPKVMEFCDQSWNFPNFDPKFSQICMFFVTTKIEQKSRRSPFSNVFRKMSRMQNQEERNGHGKVIEKYFVKYVGNLNNRLLPPLFCLPRTRCSSIYSRMVLRSSGTAYGSCDVTPRRSANIGPSASRTSSSL